MLKARANATSSSLIDVVVVVAVVDDAADAVDSAIGIGVDLGPRGEREVVRPPAPDCFKKREKTQWKRLSAIWCESLAG